MERGLDAVLPQWDWHEVHTRVVAASPELALEALVEAPIASGAIAALFKARGMKPGGTILEGLAQIRFAELARSPTEIVMGASGSPWRLHGEMGEFAVRKPRTVLIACDLRAAPLEEGRSLLSTETRIKAVDAHARRSFAWYWRVVRPWSALVRRSWLRSAAHRLGGD